VDGHSDLIRSRGAKVKVLLVEDDDRIVRFLKRGLEPEHYTVDVASDGRAGIEMAGSGAYDAIILDLMLPVMGGREVYLHLRATNVETPILVLSAIEAPEIKMQALQEGVEDYVTKPFSFEDLLTRLNAMVHRAGQKTKPMASESQGGE